MGQVCTWTRALGQKRGAHVLPSPRNSVWSQRRCEYGHLFRWDPKKERKWKMSTCMPQWIYHRDRFLEFSHRPRSRGFCQGLHLLSIHGMWGTSRPRTGADKTSTIMSPTGSGPPEAKKDRNGAWHSFVRLQRRGARPGVLGSSLFFLNTELRWCSYRHHKKIQSWLIPLFQFIIVVCPTEPTILAISSKCLSTLERSFTMELLQLGWKRTRMSQVPASVVYNSSLSLLMASDGYRLHAQTCILGKSI